MDSRHIGVGTLLVLVALAGCNGIAGPDTVTETTAITPVAVPTTDTGTGPAVETTRTREWPPGISNRSLVDPVALVSAHVLELERRSYTVWQRRQVVAANGTTLVNRTVRGRFSAGERYRVVIERRGTTAMGDSKRVVAYSDGQRASREVTVRRDGDQRLLRNRSRVDIPAAPRSVLDVRPAFGPRLRWAFTAADNVTVDRTFSNTLGGGDSNYHLTATLASDGTVGPAVSNGTVRATVDPNGIVRLYSLTYTTTRGGNRVRVRERGGYVNLAVAD